MIKVWWRLVCVCTWKSQFVFLPLELTNSSNKSVSWIHPLDIPAKKKNCITEQSLRKEYIQYATHVLHTFQSKHITTSPISSPNIHGYIRWKREQEDGDVSIIPAHFNLSQAPQEEEASARVNCGAFSKRINAEHRCGGAHDSFLRKSV